METRAVFAVLYEVRAVVSYCTLATAAIVIALATLSSPWAQNCIPATVEPVAGGVTVQVVAVQMIISALFAIDREVPVTVVRTAGT